MSHRNEHTDPFDNNINIGAVPGDSLAASAAGRTRVTTTDTSLRAAAGVMAPRQLRRADGAWSRQHGQWHWQFELPASATGGRRPVRHGLMSARPTPKRCWTGFMPPWPWPTPPTPSPSAASDPSRPQAGETVPDPEQVRRALHLEVCPHQIVGRLGASGSR